MIGEKGTALKVAIFGGAIIFSFAAFFLIDKKKKKCTKLTLHQPVWVHGKEPLDIIKIARDRFSNGIGIEICQNDIKDFDCQVGGHMAINGRPGVKRLGTSYIMKPVIKDSRGSREVGFYEAVYGGAFNAAFCTLKDFIPLYYGVYCPPDNSYDFLVLSDVTRLYSCPCAMDVKMGTQSFEPDAPPEKRARELIKYPEQKKLGFRITGLRVYNIKQKQHIVVDKAHLPSGNILANLGKGFYDGERLRIPVLKEILAKIKTVLDWFLLQNSLWFVSSSLLLTYEGDPSCPVKTDLKIIDFAHIRNGDSKDTGFILGLQNLIERLETLIENEVYYCSILSSDSTFI